MDYISALAELGLTPTESDIYLFLLQNGRCSAMQIQGALNLDKVPVYRALATLRDKGYAESLGETRNQIFVAAPIQTMLSKYDERAQSLAAARKGIASLVHELSHKQHALYKENRITIYEGLDGYKLWNEDRIQSADKVIRELGQNIFFEQFFPTNKAYTEYIENYIKRRVSKGITVRLMGESTRNAPQFRSSAEKMKDIRMIDLPDKIDALISVFGNKFSFYTMQSGKYIGVTVDDPMLASMMTIFFDALWQQGTPA